MSSSTAASTLQLPPHYKPQRVKDLFFVDYENLAPAAEQWADRNGLTPAGSDKTKIVVVPIDVQLTFVHPQGGLPVGGAYDDCIRTCDFIYRNMHLITSIAPTLDTHTVMQIFHSIFLVDSNGNHPTPCIPIPDDDIQNGTWQINPAVAWNIVNGNYTYLQEYLKHYSGQLKKGKQYTLIPWPYHAILGGLEHALVPLLHEAIFFHTIARSSERKTQIKGGNPLTENYSPIQPDVLVDHKGVARAQKNVAFLQILFEADYVITLGQAKSHCLAWFINNLLDEIMKKDPSLARKVYILEDCTSPVVVPGIIDFTTQANEAFDRFRNAGMNIVKSTDPIISWPGIHID